MPKYSSIVALTLTAFSALNVSTARADIQITHAMNEYLNPFQATSHETHQVSVLSGDAAIFEKRLDMIEDAQDGIWIDSNLLKKDDTGRAVLQALLHKARAMTYVRYDDGHGNIQTGLMNPKTGKVFQVGILIDDRAQKGSPDINEYLAFQLGVFDIRVRYFNVTDVNPELRNYEDHRNLFIADDETCLGGGDISDAGSKSQQEFCVKGEITRSSRKSFLAFWRLRDDSSSGSFAEIPEDPRAPVAAEDLAKYKRSTQEARDFLMLDHEDAEFDARLVKRRAEGKDALASAIIIPSTDVTFISDRPGRAKDEHLVFQENKRAEKSEDASCVTSLDPGVSSQSIDSDAMICINKNPDLSKKLRGEVESHE